MAGPHRRDPPALLAPEPRRRAEGHERRVRLIESPIGLHFSVRRNVFSNDSRRPRRRHFAEFRLGSCPSGLFDRRQGMACLAGTPSVALRDESLNPVNRRECRRVPQPLIEPRTSSSGGRGGYHLKREADRINTLLRRGEDVVASRLLPRDLGRELTSSLANE